MRDQKSGAGNRLFAEFRRFRLLSPDFLHCLQNSPNGAGKTPRPIGSSTYVLLLVLVVVIHDLVVSVVILTALGIAALLAHEKEETRDLISPWISLAGRALGRIRPLLEAGPESSARRACEQVSLLVSLRNLLSYPWIAQKVGRQELALHAWYFDLEQGELLGYFPASGGFEPLIVRP